MGGVGVRIRGAVVRCHDDDFGAGLSNSMHLRHGTQNVRLMFEKMRDVNPACAVVLKWPREMRQVAEHVGRGTGLAIKADRRRILLFLSASYVKNKHEEKTSPESSVNNVQ